MPMISGTIKDNLERVLQSIREAEMAADRAEGSVSLLAVSKFHPASTVLQAAAAGQTSFGENRVQEAVAKFKEVREAMEAASPCRPQGLCIETAAPSDIKLHIIGTLQSNKIGKAVLAADMIESADSMEHLKIIEKQCAKINKTIQVLFELHTGEESKSGFESEEAMEKAVAYCAEGNAPHVVPCGFMTMAPLTDDERVQRKSFARLREAKIRLQGEFPALPLKTLSMGMSADFRAAIMEGSTEVRIGTAIFGSRETNAVH